MEKSDIGIIIQVIAGTITGLLIFFGITNKNIILGVISLIPLGIFSFYWFKNINKKINKLEERTKKLTDVFNNQKDMINIRERLARVETVLDERKMNNEKNKIKRKGQVDPLTMLIIIIIIVVLILYFTGSLNI